MRGCELTVQERDLILRGVREGKSGRAIARQIRRHPSVLNREIARNGGRDACHVHDAHSRAERLRRRPWTRKLESNRRLRDAVAGYLADDLSPQQAENRLARVPYDRTADRVAVLLSQKMNTLPAALKRSLTWDQGTEMADHATFTVTTNIPVYFCDPHSPWRRGSNENTNGLLRQYFPKGTDLSGHTQADLDTVADRPNRRPRMTLGWRTPAETLDDYLRKHTDALTP